MTNARERVENLEYRIKQDKKLLNAQDKNSEAYKLINRELDGLKSALRVAKSALKTEINAIKRNIKLVKMESKTSSHPTLQLKCQREFERLQAELKKLKG